MNIIKVLNNSLVLAVDQNGEEVIVMGKGIGFKGKAGDNLTKDQIDKVFVVKNEKEVNEYAEFIEKTPPEYIEIVETILENANHQLGGKLSDQLFIMLLDHISYAIIRHTQGIVIQNRLLSQVKKFYPKEFELGKQAVALINQRLNIDLPEEEAGNIAFHLMNAQTDEQLMENTLVTVKLLKDILAIVQYYFNISIDEESLSYSRFITHLQFFIQRLLEDKLMESKDDFIFDQITQKYEKEYQCARRIAEYIDKKLNKQIAKDELLYLTIHITRIVETSTKS